MSLHGPSNTSAPRASRRRWLRLVGGLLLGIVLLAGAGLAVIEARWTRRFEAPYPAIAASADPAVVSQGEYLVYGAAACAYCHVPREQWQALDRGERLPLTGHHLFPMPFGDIYSSNLTPHATSGIGRRTDGELARILRFGVRADGRAAFPLMEFQLSDADIAAVITYLRSRPEVDHVVPEHDLTQFGKALMAFAIEPSRPAAPAPSVSPAGATVERGAYLANHVSSCVACHTDRGEDGTLVGPAFGGGQRMDVAADPTIVFVTPNLTPDPATSPIGRWSEDTFIARFKKGEQVAGTPMPWGAFARLTDDDLRALYRYLRSLPPTRHRTGSAVQAKRAASAE
jgi:mono/diheme cytochrome c family protein